MEIIVFSPPQNPKSAGSLFLYNLANEIRDLGYTAIRIIIAQDKTGLFFISVDENNYIPLATDTLEKLFDPQNSLIIHGENLHHKFFDKFKVARYYLNRIGALANIGVPRIDEYKIAWNSNFVDNPDFILRKPLLKKPDKETLLLDQPRSLDLTYIGKGVMYDNKFSRLPSTLELKRNWPENNDEYLFLLSMSRFLFTYDVQTAVIQEAIYYGVMPVLLTHFPLGSMEELLASYPSELRACCLLINEFNELKSGKSTNFLSNFAENRDKYITTLDEQEKNYLDQLRKLIRSIQKHFKLTSFDAVNNTQQITTTGSNQNLR